MNSLTKSIIPVVFSLVLLAPAKAGQNAMEKAKALASQAHTVLKDGATLDKGGHRVAAMKHLQAAIAEIEAGIAYDKANVSKNEGKKREDKKKR